MSLVLRAACLTFCLISFAVAQNREGGAAREGGERNSAEAQAQQGPPVKTGRILETEVKGKTTTLKLETSDGESYELKITPQIDFAVIGKGDAGFVRPGAYINARGVMTNETLFVKQLTVVLLPKGKRPPLGKIQKAMVSEGESLQSYDIAGEISELAPAADYPDHTAVGLKMGGKPQAVWLEPNYTVNVASTNPAHAAVGADVEIGMRPLRGGKLQPVALRVHRSSDFKSEEIQAEADEK